MSMIFNADEIFKIAEQIERNAVAFYEKAAERFEGEAKRALLGLVAMERVHERTFAAMRRELSGAGKGQEALDPDGEAGRYLAALADGQIFDLNTEPATLFGEGESVGEILEIAINLEKDSVVFYVGMKTAVPESLGKDKIEKIIREEMEHIVFLRRIASSLDK